MKPLLILDLNGTILHRLTRSHERSAARIHPSYTGPSYTVNGHPCFLRPHLHTFLQWAFGVFEVGVWTSARRMNAVPMTMNALQDFVDFSEMESELKAFTSFESLTKNDAGRYKLKFLWNQEQCVITYKPKTDTDFNYKPHFVKDLNRVFAQYHQYNTTNTFIIDDSSAKIKPDHISCLIKIKEFRVDNKAVDYKKDNELLQLKSILQRRLDLIADDGVQNKDNQEEQ